MALTARQRRLLDKANKLNTGSAGEQVEHDPWADDADPLEADTPLIGTAELAELLGTTRQTLCRWRMAGFMPAAIHSDRSGTFWTRSSIRMWLASSQWANPELSHRVIRHARKHGWDFWEWLTPEPAEREPSDPELRQLVADLEQLVWQFERLRKRGKRSKGNRIKFLIQRLYELNDEDDDDE